MKHIFYAGAIAALSTSTALAGGLDRSGQSISALFEQGSYAELSFGNINPSVTGTFGAATQSGDMAPSYNQLGFAIKTDINEKFSVALIADQPFGANVSYPVGTGYPLAGTTAEVKSTALTAVGRYKINDNFSVHAGLRHVSVEGNVNLPSGPYAASYGNDSDTGYLVGAAYERPDIAMRVALTYSSATKHSMPAMAGANPAALGPAGAVAVTLPQSVNLDFQSGVAADTLVFGSIRWANWTATRLNSPGYPANPLVSYANDTFTYSLGVGRKFNDTWSGAVSLGYEKSNGGLASNLSPTDGNTSIGLGMTYAMNNIKVTGGVRYVKLGNATTETIGARFTGNSAVALGLKVGINF